MCVQAQDTGRPGCRPDQVKQQADRRLLAGSIRSQEPKDLACLHEQIDVNDPARLAVELGELAGIDCGGHQGTSFLSSSRSTSHRSKSLGRSRSKNAYMSRASCSGGGLNPANTLSSRFGPVMQ